MTDPLTEDAGLAKIHSVCAKMSAVWRPTSSHDLGIDGQIEFLKPRSYESTGDILAIQCKSGSSYFRKQDATYVYFYPKARHRRYWKTLKLPVVLVLHNPDADLTLYAAVKPQLDDDQPLKISKVNSFTPDCRDALLSISQDEMPFFDPSKLLLKFAKIKRSRGEDQTITGIDFLLACTNRPKAYFELRMCRVAALLAVLEGSSGVSIVQADYEFILRNVLQISAASLTEDFLDEFNTQWFELELVPDIVVSLTDRGQQLIEHLWNNLNLFLSIQAYENVGILSAAELAERISTVSQNASDRLDRSDRLGFVPR
jgi:hypothetical protein